ALAGIFFSTRLVPGPVAGNTPLVRVPLLSPNELTRVHAEDAALKSRRAELEQTLPDASDRAYVSFLRRVISTKIAAYLEAASEYRRSHSSVDRRLLETLAKQRSLDPKLLEGFVGYLNRVMAHSSIPHHPTLRDVAAGTLTGSGLEKSAAALAKELA